MNENIGLTNKLNKQIDERLKSAQVDYDFYSTGFPITGVEKASANHLFGNGKWKKAVKDALGDDVFNQYADKYGNRPVDFQLTALRTKFSSYFLPNEKIMIKANGINTVGKVLAIQDKQYIVLMAPYEKGATYNSGLVINDSRLTGAKNAIDRFTQAITDSKPSNFIDTTTPKNVENHANNFGLKDPVKPITNNKQLVTKPDHSKKVISIILIIAGIVILASVYKNYKKNN